MSNKVNERINNPIDVVQSDSENLCNLITHPYIPRVDYDRRQIRDKAGENDAASYDEEPAYSSSLPDDDDKHDAVHDDDEEDW